VAIASSITDAKATINRINIAIDEYFTDNGKYPESIDVLKEEKYLKIKKSTL